MQTGEINLPDPLLDAQVRGDLVVFAGAGVSVAPPSNYPQLKELATRISEEASMKPREGEPLDRFLGRLSDEGVKVHEKLRDLLTDPKSKPSPLHYDLLKLFRCARDVRLVTTNFDTHFDVAVAKVFDEPVTVYYAPALPLGYEVDGLVYLHGTVARAPKRIVLTDGDFGRAYLTEGWARRFLQELFLTYTVLFVGYSHNDPVMNYLARGLPPRAAGKTNGTLVRRYALTPSKNHGHWEFLGIEPITYPLTDGENPHQALADSIARWARVSRMEQGEHKRRIKEIAEHGPPEDEATVDYLRRALKDPASLQVFIRHAGGRPWMKWIEQQGFFDPLMRIGSVDETSVDVARWFVAEFAVRDADEALKLLRRHGGTLNPILWDELVERLATSGAESPEPAALEKWVPVLLHPAQQGKSPEKLMRLLQRCDRDGDEASALLLLEYLTRPYLSLEEKSGGKRTKHGRVPQLWLEGDPAELQRTWESVFRPRLDDFVEWLSPILAAQLANAKLLAATAGGRRRPTAPGMQFLQEASEEVKQAARTKKAA